VQRQPISFLLVVNAHPSGVCDTNMNKTRLSLLYLGSYLVLIGLGLLVADGGGIVRRSAEES